jgi:hypothetical protein
MPSVTPEEIEHGIDPQHCASALFGYVSGLPDHQFLQYVFSHRFHKVIRRVFFSEIEKRSQLDVDAVDAVGEALLSAIEDGVNRSSDETLIRYLIPHMSMQIRTRTFKIILRLGTKTTRAYLLRRSSPETTPGIEETVLAEALRGNEDALVGIVYRWPPLVWRELAADLFVAASQLPWLQRQIVFKSNDPDMFLDRNLIKDPVTELYVRARHRRKASDYLMDSAIQAVRNEPASYAGSDRMGLVAWCLGRYGAFDRLQTLPPSFPSVLRETLDGRSEPPYQAMT